MKRKGKKAACMKKWIKKESDENGHREDIIYTKRGYLFVRIFTPPIHVMKCL